MSPNNDNICSNEEKTATLMRDEFIGEFEKQQQNLLKILR